MLDDPSANVNGQGQGSSMTDPFDSTLSMGLGDQSNGALMSGNGDRNNNGNSDLFTLGGNGGDDSGMGWNMNDQSELGALS